MKRLADQTLYEILEVPPDATPVAIAEAVERALELYGPGSLATYTLMSTEEASLLTRRIEEARSTLLDPAARARYDAGLSAGPGEARAAASGANGTPPPVWTVPPVIPAIHPVPAQPRRSGDEDAARRQPPDSAPFPSEPAALAPPAPEPPPRAARPPPILLDREVAPPAAPLATPAEAPERPAPAAAVPTATPLPAPPVPTPPAPVPLGSPLVLDDTAWTGEVLRRLREARGITLQQIAERTKVTRHHIENIEGDRYSVLPASVYLRGILLSMARELRLDGPKVARSYLERVASGSPPSGGQPKPR